MKKVSKLKLFFCLLLETQIYVHMQKSWSINLILGKTRVFRIS